MAKAIEYLIVWRYEPDELQGDFLSGPNRDVVKATSVQRGISKLWKVMSAEYALDKRHFRVLAALPYDTHWMDIR